MRLAIALFKMPSPIGRTQRPNIALMLSHRWFVHWSNLNFFYGSPFYWGIFLFVPSFAHKKIASIHLFFDFVETQMSNDCIGWFSTLKHILKGHAGMWSKLGDFYLVFVELSCVMWMLKKLEFGVWSLELHYATCNCASRLIVCNFCLLFNMVGVASWNLGWGCGWVHSHCYCKWAKSFETRIQLA